MKGDCLVCNTALTLSETHVKDVFSDTNRFSTNTTLVATLQDILEKTLDENHSKCLCQKCYKTCAEYNEYKSKINSIKRNMSKEYDSTINGAVNKVPIKVYFAPKGKPKGTIVVPASKLVPVPADFQLNFGQLTQAVSKAKPMPLYNFKVTLGSSSLAQSTPTVKVSQSLVNSATGVMSTVNNDITSDWDANMVPAEIFSTAEDDSQIAGDDDENGGKNDGEMKGNCDEKEHDMEIDEDCSTSAVAVTSDNSNDIVKIKSEPDQVTEYANIITLTESDAGGDTGNYILGNLKMYKQAHSGDDDDDDDDDEHTIVVNGDDSSILEMMQGQQVIYENGGLSLVMEDQGEDAGEDDGQDSNDESQIELQVSGDEETAKAIIAAAQEQGGAFIKVESGEMYRVKSVQSADGSVDYDVDTLVTQHDSHFSCNLCHREEEGEDILLKAGPMMQHLKTVHLAKIFLCQICGRGMRKRHEYTKHLEEHAQKSGKGVAVKRVHACSECEKSYNSRTLLQQHMNTHTGARPHACSVCDKKFASKYTHQAHMKTHQVRPRPFHCNDCSKSFLSVQNLRQHEKTHSGIKNFLCKVCGKAFGTQHNLEIHGVVHSRDRPFICAYCGKGFSRKADLSDHRRTHTGERPFECEHCGARFAQRSNLHSHRRATHLDDKRHKCPDCPKRFKRRRLLEYHIKATHTGERPLKCEVCSASFVYPEHFKKHVKIHTGIRPYFCEICGKSFNSRDNRNTHRFTHSEKKPYECLACGHSYMRKRTLIQHMNDSGHLAESIVVNQPRVTKVHKNETGVTTLKVKGQENKTIEDSVDTVVFRTSGKLETLDKPATITKMLADEDVKFYIENETLVGDTEEAELLEAVDASCVQINEQTAHLGTDENGSVLRLIQVKLPNGTDGWVALND